MKRRRREGKTDYRLRLGLLRSGKPRLVVRFSIRRALVQFVDYQPAGDRIIASASSPQLTAYGWSGSGSNTPAAYFTGLLAGRRAYQAGLREANLDISRATPSKGSKVFAVVRGVLDAGIQVPCKEDMLPSPERIRGEHLSKKPKDWEDVKTRIMEQG